MQLDFWCCMTCWETPAAAAQTLSWVAWSFWSTGLALGGHSEATRALHLFWESRPGLQPWACPQGGQTEADVLGASLAFERLPSGKGTASCYHGLPLREGATDPAPCDRNSKVTGTCSCHSPAAAPPCRLRFRLLMRKEPQGTLGPVAT